MFGRRQVPVGKRAPVSFIRAVLGSLGVFVVIVVVAILLG